MRVAEFFYRLWFTKDDDLDLTQLYLFGSLLLIAVSVIMVGNETWKLPPEVWSFFKYMLGTLAIIGTPKWVAELLARRSDGIPFARSSEDMVTGRVNAPDDA